MMKKTYSLSKNEIISNQYGLIKEICSCVLVRNNETHLISDLTQEICLILLSQDDITIQSLHETNQLRYFIARIVTNQVLSTTSPFHRKYRLQKFKTPIIYDDYNPLADVMWREALILDDNIIVLRFEYGLKIREIAKINGITPRYVHYQINKYLSTLKEKSES